jgi:hypothetical protein
MHKRTQGVSGHYLSFFEKKKDQAKSKQGKEETGS